MLINDKMIWIQLMFALQCAFFVPFNHICGHHRTELYDSLCHLWIHFGKRFNCRWRAHCSCNWYCQQIFHFQKRKKKNYSQILSFARIFQNSTSFRIFYCMQSTMACILSRKIIFNRHVWHRRMCDRCLSNNFECILFEWPFISSLK